jgi:DNA-binding protein H-NS
MSNTYAELQAQIAELQKRAMEARTTEVAAAKEQIRSIMQEYNLTIADLGGVTKSAKPRKSVAAKYRDKATGQEWTGRGRAPKWLAGKDRAEFLIK